MRSARRSVASTPSAVKDRLVNQAPPSFSGRFDLFLSRPTLVDLFKLSPERLHNVFITRRAQDKVWAQIAISQAGTGRFRAASICHPVKKMTLQPIYLKSGKVQEKVSFSQTETDRAQNIVTGPGFEAELELDDNDLNRMGMKSGVGDLKLRRIWKGPLLQGEEVEIFEGVVSFFVVYGETLRENNHGSKKKWENLKFWAIRANKDEKREWLSLSDEGPPPNRRAEEDAEEMQRLMDEEEEEDERIFFEVYGGRQDTRASSDEDDEDDSKDSDF